MEWKSIPDLIEEYRQQVDIINQRISTIHNRQPDDAPIGGQDDIDKLCSMRNDLIYSIRLMSKYI